MAVAVVIAPAATRRFIAELATAIVQPTNQYIVAGIVDNVASRSNQKRGAVNDSE